MYRGKILRTTDQQGSDMHDPSPVNGNDQRYFIPKNLDMQGLPG
jgi:hypothetical protein